MSFAAWNDSYSVKVLQIDTEHKKLFAIISDLYDGMKAGRGKDVLGNVLNQLVNYTERHFSGEEELMRKAGYADLEKHISVHREFTTKIKGFANDVRSGAAGVSVELLNFLNDWLTQHIKGTDQRYSATLNGAGIR